MKLGIYIFSKIYLVILFIVIVVAVGILCFIYIEGYTIGDAVNIEVITLSTFSFQQLHEFSPLARMFTTFLIITSFGTFANAVNILTNYIVHRKINHLFRILHIT